MEEQNAQQCQNLPPIWKRSLDPAIHVQVYKNGDEHFPGKMVTLNRKQQRTFDSWLVDLSTSMKLQSGSVWRVFTPTHGHRVDDFDCLEDGKVIVVAGQERFKPLRYTQIEHTQNKPKSYGDLPGWPSRKYQVSGKCRKVHTQAIIIKCWPNGDVTKRPRTVLLPPKCPCVEDVTSQVSAVLCHELGGPVEKLYLLSGIKVMSMDQITPNCCLVAAKRGERFKCVHYKEASLPNLRCSPRLERKLAPLSHSNRTSSHSSPEHSITSQNGYRRDRERARKEEEQVFRPVKHRSKGRSERPRQPDYDKDNGGVFKAKSQNHATRGARQIEDSRQTRTELPVDQRLAETVEDEEYERCSSHDDGTDDSNRDHVLQDESHTPPQADPQKAYRANSRHPDSPGNKQARKEKEKEARARREAEDRARAEKQQQQQEAIRQRKKEKEELKKREEEKRKEEGKERERRRKEQEEEEKRKEAKKREEQERKREEAKRKKEEEERRREEEEKERRKREEEEEERRKREEEEEEKRKAAADARTSTPKRNERTPTPDKQPSPSQKEKEEEEWAATKIQAGFRGYRERRDLKQQKSDEDDEQSGGRDSSLMRDEPIPIQGEEDLGAEPFPDDREEQEQAAIRIQAGFRGAKARKEVKLMRDTNQAQGKTSPRPPSEDPSHTRTVSPNLDTNRNDNENQFTEMDAEHAAATKIQAAFRGQQTRKELAAEKDKAKGEGNEDGAEH